MIQRIKAAWAALRGAVVLQADHWCVVATDANGVPIVTRWNGLVAEDAAMALYRGADSVAAKLPNRSFKVH